MPANFQAFLRYSLLYRIEKCDRYDIGLTGTNRTSLFRTLKTFTTLMKSGVWVSNKIFLKL